MGNPAGVKRDFDALERRRFKAFALLSKGLNEAEVARQVGVHRQSVNRWAKAIGEQGREGLKQAGRAGRKSRLSEAELKQLRRSTYIYWPLQGRLVCLLERNLFASCVDHISGQNPAHHCSHVAGGGRLSHYAVAAAP